MSDLQKITDQQMDAVGVCSAPDVLSGSTSENKAVFDKMVRQLIAPAYNAAVDAIDAINETETGIQAAEAERVSAEDGRVSAEAERETAEEARVSAEEARVQAEQERAAAEEQREAAETGYVAQAEDAAQLSENWAQSSESWAVGGTGTRSGEDTNNAKYWSDEARKAAGGGVASFNGRTGVVLPEEGDYTREMLGIRMIRFGPQTSGDAFAITAEQMDQMLSDYPPLVFVTVEGLEIMLTRYDKTSDTAYYSNALYDQDRKRFVRLAAKGTSATVHSAEEGQIPMPSGDGDNGKYLKANSGGGFDLIPREFFKKAETLSDETAALYGLDSNAVPDDAFKRAFMPTGMILWYPDTTAPDGFLICDGSLISRADYAALFAVIGTIFGSGDGSTTFALPDLRAVFIRGAGTSGSYRAVFAEKQEATSINEMLSGNAAISVSNADYGTSSSGRYASLNETTTCKRYAVRPYNMVLTPIIKY